jgi:hypothetical protein
MNKEEDKGIFFIYLTKNYTSYETSNEGKYEGGEDEHN